MSVKDKGHPTNRRLAAVSFLNNISLNGSYKDSSWPLDSEKEELPQQQDSTPTTFSVNLEVSIHQKSKTVTAFGDTHHPHRLRANTGNYGHCSDGHSSYQPKHAHFSSTESLDHGKNPISGPTPSELSIHREKTTMVNMKTDSLPSIRNERLVILVSHRSPLVVFSALPYSRDNRLNKIADHRPELIRRTRNTSGSRPISTMTDPDPLEQLLHYQEEEVSYGYLLQPTKAFHQSINQEPIGATDEVDNSSLSRCYSYDGAPMDNSSISDGENPDQRGLVIGGVGGGPRSTISAYSPHTLDDPEFRAGKHRTLLTFPSYITSVIDYCKASDMKKELNDKFKDRFPHIHLTLSKLRSLKREMRRVAKAECNVDLLTVAQAYVYFEKLILGSFVTKYNRKFCAGACLLLSAKLNDVKGYHLHNLLDVIERTFRVNGKELLSFEFAVLVALEFTLHLPTWEVFPHYQRLLYES